VEVDLLSGSTPIGGAGIDDFGGARVVRVIANVLDKQVGVGTDFLFHDKRRFGDRIALLARKPKLCKLPLRPQPPPISRVQWNWI
jgi:hypothetical protein